MPEPEHPRPYGGLYPHRSNQAIAFARAILALMFALWVWIAPDQPARQPAIGYGLMAGYIAFSLIVLRIAWQDWWLDFQLSRIAFFVDSAVFLVALLFTQSADGEFFSPYFAFLAYLILSAVLRWNWQAALAVGIFLCLGFLAVSELLSVAGQELELTKLIRRISYMAVVAAMVVWLAVRRGGVVIDVAELPDPAFGELAAINALHWAMARFRATGGALSWYEQDETHGRLHSAGALGDRLEMLMPDLASDQDQAGQGLFDLPRQRALLIDKGDTVVASTQFPVPPLVAQLGIDEALVLPLRGDEGSGTLVLSGIPGMTCDDLPLGQAIAAEVARLLDRSKAADDARAAVAARVRSSLARDLHDSVAQSLAGTGFRLAALRARIEAGEEPLAELDAIRSGLQAEQLHLRQMIESLRTREQLRAEVDLATALADLAASLARQWGVVISFDPCAEAFPIQAERMFDCQQIVREAVANAVRHGAASRITVALHDRDGSYSLMIADDGRGFPIEKPVLPRSIAERVATMHAKLEVQSEPGHTLIAITIPAGERA